MTPIPVPSTLPDLRGLTFLGRRALLRVLEHVIWGEQLSQAVCRQLAEDSPEQRLRLHFETQAAEEHQHEVFFRALYHQFCRRDTPPLEPRISRSLQAFGQELRQSAMKKHHGQAYWGLGVCLEGLATVLFERSLRDCVKYWPEGEASLRQIHREEARHVRAGRFLLDWYLELSTEENCRTLKIQADRWQGMVHRSFREIAWQVFPFPVPVRALQRSFSDFVSAVILEKRLATGDRTRVPVIGNKKPEDLKKTTPDADLVKFS